MTAAQTTTRAERDAWRRDNLAALTAELEHVRALLTGADSPPPAPAEGVATALDLVCETFGLTTFERGVVLLVAGPDLLAGFGSAIVHASGNPLSDRPTFGLALRLLPDAHWSALSPDSALRRWRLVDLGPGALTAAPLRADEWLLHALVGVASSDLRLAGTVEPLVVAAPPTPSTGTAARTIAGTWQRRGAAPITLRGRSPYLRRAAFAAACDAVGWRAFVVDAGDLVLAPADRATIRTLWERETRLDPAALLVEVADDAEPAARRAAQRFTEGLAAPVVVAVGEGERGTSQPTVVVDASHPVAAEQRDLWRAALGGSSRFAGLNGVLDRVVAQFDLDAEAIVSAAEQALGDGGEAEAAAQVWDACRVSARGGLDDLAQRIESRATLDDLVLPAPQLEVLRDIVAQVRQRARVYGEWQMAGPAGTGLGITALFSGPSGTGKTLAAGVIANALALDLYRIDLSQVVSKYIGETEKNLRRIFTAASRSGAVLLFDEADALFGKRSEVRDSHDRYANLEVSYLLQAMEAYRGLGILTTNLKHALDPAFLRRLRFVLAFPFPGPAERAEIWRRAFPPAAPTHELRFDRLARLSVAGGDIRNIAVHAAFRAAEAGTPIGMAEVAGAAAAEFAKLDRQLGDTEIGGWL